MFWRLTRAVKKAYLTCALVGMKRVPFLWVQCLKAVVRVYSVQRDRQEPLRLHDCWELTKVMNSITILIITQKILVCLALYHETQKRCTGNPVRESQITSALPLGRRKPTPRMGD